jgi:hypothetical protein
MVVPLVILVGHHIAMGPPPGLPCLRVVAPSGTAFGSVPLRATGQAAPSYQRCRTAALSASVWLQRQIVGSPGYHAVGAVGPLHRQSTPLPGRRAVGLRPFPAPPSYLRCRTTALSASEWPRRKYLEVRIVAAVLFFFPIKDRFASPCRSSPLHRRHS